ncbi:MAG: type IV secretory system conjugative DNA transfer family protein [Rhizomicrobium sp.]
MAKPASRRRTRCSPFSTAKAKALTVQPVANKVIDSRSVYLGRYDNPQFPEAKEPLAYKGERHLLLFGPNGSGKGTRLFVNNLLSMQEQSAIVVDPKGELTAITADFRRRVSEVVILNPFGVLGIPGSGFNPLASLDPMSELLFDDAFGVGEALIKIEENDPHWSESAQSLAVGFVMWEVKLAEREKTASAARKRPLHADRARRIRGRQ